MNAMKKVQMLLLAVCLVVVMMPAVFAENAYGEEATYSNPTYMALGSTAIVQDAQGMRIPYYFTTDSDGLAHMQNSQDENTTIIYTPTTGTEPATLTLDGAELKEMAKDDINNFYFGIKITGDIKINITGYGGDLDYSETTTTEGNTYGIYVTGKLFVTGEGDLNITSPNNSATAGYSYAVHSGEDMSISGSELRTRFNGGTSKKLSGVVESDSLTVSGAAVNIVGGEGASTSFACNVYGDINVKDFGSLKISCTQGNNEVYAIYRGRIIVDQGALTLQATYKLADYNNRTISLGTGVKAYSSMQIDGSGARTTYEAPSATFTEGSKYFRVATFVDSVSFVYPTMVVLAGATTYQGELVEPYNASDPSVTWKSSDTSVAKVSEYGRVTGIKAGKAVITCYANDYLTDQPSGSYLVTVLPKQMIDFSKFKSVISGSYVKSSWAKVISASQYKVTILKFAPGASTYTKSTVTTSSNAYAFKWKAGYYYDVKVACIQKYNGSSYTSPGSKYRNLYSKMTASLAKKSSTSFKVSWKKYNSSSHVSYYQIKLAKNQKMTSGVKYINVSKSSASKTFTKLSRGGNYYLKIRAKVAYSSQSYSPWSSEYHIDL